MKTLIKILCGYCNKNQAFKTDGKSKYECENHANTGSCDGYKSLKRDGNVQQNNEPCLCGSGNKYKKCCK